MAKRGGIFQAFRTLFRVSIAALAAVLAFAIYLNWQSGEEVAAVAPVAPEVVAEAEPPVEEVVEVAPEVAAEISEEAEDAVAALTEAADAVEQTVETTTEAVEEVVTEVEDAVVEQVEGVVAEATDAVQDAVTEVTKADPTTIMVPGTDISFTLINAFRRDNGAIEVTTEQLTGGSGATLLLVTCAPLAVGTIATGDSAGTLGARTEDPEMTEIPLSDPRAMIAGTACGVMR